MAVPYSFLPKFIKVLPYSPFMSIDFGGGMVKGGINFADSSVQYLSKTGGYLNEGYTRFTRNMNVPSYTLPFQGRLYNGEELEQLRNAQQKRMDYQKETDRRVEEVKENYNNLYNFYNNNVTKPLNKVIDKVADPNSFDSKLGENVTPAATLKKLGLVAAAVGEGAHQYAQTKSKQEGITNTGVSGIVTFLGRRYFPIGTDRMARTIYEEVAEYPVNKMVPYVFNTNEVYAAEQLEHIPGD